MSAQDYLRLDDSIPDAKYEYIDGVARLMSGGSGEHDQIAFNIRAVLDQHFQSGPCFVRGSDMRVLVSNQASGRQSYVYPDATVSCDVADRRRGNKLIRSPRLIVEVLSPSTEALDKGQKLAAYQACPTIHEIALIDQFEQQVFIYRRNEEDEMLWHHAYYGSGSTVEFRSVDVHVEMDEIYKGIDFDEPLVEY